MHDQYDNTIIAGRYVCWVAVTKFLTSHRVLINYSSRISSRYCYSRETLSVRVTKNVSVHKSTLVDAGGWLVRVIAKRAVVKKLPDHASLSIQSVTSFELPFHSSLTCS